jgi:hypothetical protein
VAGTAAAGSGAGDASRRQALQVLLVRGGAAVFGGVVVAANCSGSGTRMPVLRPAREVQQQRGLFVDAGEQRFTFGDGLTVDSTGAALEPQRLRALHQTLRPADAALLPHYVPTLLTAFDAPQGDRLLADFRAIDTTAMRAALAQAKALRELLEHAERVRTWALVVDLPGPESVAFAAGLRPFVEPVLGFDNWPHPRGVVPAHLTLAALAFHAPTLAPDPAAERRGPIAFVLDRDRLAPYRDEPDRFDNRYLAKLPTAVQLQALGVERVLYVVPAGATPLELDDLNERFVAWRQAGITVRMVGLGDFELGPAPAAAAGQPTPAPRYWWHGSPGSHWWFWNHHGWASRASGITPVAPQRASFGSSWTPNARATPFGAVGGLTPGRVRDQAAERDQRSRGGSWGRSSRGWSGG